jgi:hypothetical protein
VSTGLEQRWPRSFTQNFNSKKNRFTLLATVSKPAYAHTYSFDGSALFGRNFFGRINFDEFLFGRINLDGLILTDFCLDGLIWTEYFWRKNEFDGCYSDGKDGFLDGFFVTFLGSHFLKYNILSERWRHVQRFGKHCYDRFVATWFLCCGRILRAVGLIFFCVFLSKNFKIWSVVCYSGNYVFFRFFRFVCY